VGNSVVRFPLWHITTASIVKTRPVTSLTFRLQHIVVACIQLKVVINQASRQSNTQLTSTFTLVQTALASTDTSISIGGRYKSQTVRISLATNTLVQLGTPGAHGVSFTNGVNLVQWFAFKSVS